MDKKKQLIRRFHALLGRAGVTPAGKEAILDSYNVTSTTHLTETQLTEICHNLECMADPKVAQLHRLRRRLLAAIGGYLRATNRRHDIDHIKAVACRAAGTTTFNAIPPDRLRSLYGAFTTRKKDLSLAHVYADKDMRDLSQLN